MTVTREFFAFLTCTTIIMVFHCKADPLPSPTGLSYKWLDKFTVNVSWEKPSGLPDNREIEFLIENTKDNSQMCVEVRYFTVSFYTEEMDSNLTYKISTVNKSSKPLVKSTPATITIKTPKPRATIVKDFKCLIYGKEMNCSWIPADPSQNLTLSYRICGREEKAINSLKKCAQPYSNGERNGCSLHIDTTLDNICVLVETEAAMSTFMPAPAVSKVLPPKLSVTEEGDYLKVSWTQEFAKNRCWTSEVCYKKCREPSVCQNISTTEKAMRVLYDESCLYEFQSRVMSNPELCFDVVSVTSDPVTYGVTKPPNRTDTLTVVAIVIPILLALCVILSCYCFRRHSAIICPIIPDPSAIFKEMMMNGNKELKNGTGSLYTPVPEPIEPCKITLVTENNVLQENS